MSVQLGHAQRQRPMALKRSDGDWSERDPKMLLELPFANVEE